MTVRNARMMAVALTLVASGCFGPEEGMSPYYGELATPEGARLARAEVVPEVVVPLAVRDALEVADGSELVPEVVVPLAVRDALEAAGCSKLPRVSERLERAGDLPPARLDSPLPFGSAAEVAGRGPFRSGDEVVAARREPSPSSEAVSIGPIDRRIPEEEVGPGDLLPEPDEGEIGCPPFAWSFCDDSSECESGEVCADGRCVPIWGKYYVVTAVAAEGLPERAWEGGSWDEDGSAADAYLAIEVEGQGRFRTSTSDDATSPGWDEGVVVRLDAGARFCWQLLDDDGGIDEVVLGLDCRHPAPLPEDAIRAGGFSVGDDRVRVRFRVSPLE